MNRVSHREVSLLVEGCIKCDSKSQRALYDLLFDSVLKTISVFALGKVQTEDLIQETFIKIFNNITTYDGGKSSIVTWASVIAKRTTINHIKSSKIQLVDQDISELHQEFYTTVVTSDDTQTQLIMRSIDQLPEQYRAVFEMAIFKRMEHESIGTVLGISPSSSRVYLTRAKKMLQKEMTKLGIVLHQ